jgi:DNA-binding MarR family transcriptional regulator
VIDPVCHISFLETLVVTSALKEGLASAGVGDVKPAYLGALFALWKEDGLKVVELGRRSGLETSSMTGLIDRMERDGLLERRDDASDRRVHAKPHGEGREVACAQQWIKILATVFEIPGRPVEDYRRVERVLANAHEIRDVARIRWIGHVCSYAHGPHTRSRLHSYRVLPMKFT